MNIEDREGLKKVKIEKHIADFIDIADILSLYNRYLIGLFIDPSLQYSNNSALQCSVHCAERRVVKRKPKSLKNRSDSF